ncbi:hypothetical protein A9P82_02645 [Arachidicoccus ginsenosidimutans]|uniref:type IX secretion system protein PorD n=1 Tax=Arachidicoccus sp. BS20 TaxID=1850526 RepID=UPI0007F0E65A|nr:DUF4835 family protein [Arachidicoccus sp. BS20]ANI88298.1 hypothetical protein A9P82_02645 [Arachidicoccus sp. BS20]
MLKRIVFLIIVWQCSIAGYSQELNATVTVNSQQLGTNVDQTAMQNLQQQITDFLNARKWTRDDYQPQEKISCNFNITLVSSSAQNEYQAQLLVQAARPVFNSIYQSQLVNYLDRQFVFKFQPYQQLQFNPTQIAGADVLASNLTATLAFYVNIILGMNYDSFKLNSGGAYFREAMNIVNGAPRSSDIKGWQSFDGTRNRYWLANNLTDTRFSDIHRVLYQYFRGGLDSLYDYDAKAKQNVLSALVNLQKINQANPNSMIEQFFIENRNAELAGIFKQATPDVRSQALETLLLLDPNGADKYNTELK